MVPKQTLKIALLAIAGFLLVSGAREMIPGFSPLISIVLGLILIFIGVRM